MSQTAPRHLMSDQTWQHLEPGTAGRPSDPGRTGDDTRRFLDAVFWVVRTGAPWRDLPAYFGRWNSIYRRFLRWSVSGRWMALAGQEVKVHRDGDAPHILACLDSTYVKVHQHGAPARRQRCQEGVGLSRAGKTTKIHLLCAAEADKPFEPLDLIVTPGHVADVTVAPLLPQGLGVKGILADKAYDSMSLRHAWGMHGMTSYIPYRRFAGAAPKPEVPRSLYRKRNTVERFFARLKQYRRIATRYDRRLATWAGTLCLALCRITMAP